MSRIDEIAPDIFRISTYMAAADLQFNQFLLRDEEPLLYHTGQRALFPEVLQAVRSLIPLSALRWISFSHFEADESGALNDWLHYADHAKVLTGVLTAATNVNDFSIRPARVLEDGERFQTGRHTLQFLATPYLPHNWDSSLLFDETEQVLFCSDLFLQHGDPAAFVDDIFVRAIAELEERQHSAFAHPIPYTPYTAQILIRLAALRPQVLATMHGASFKGNGATLLRELDRELRRLAAQPITNSVSLA